MGPSQGATSRHWGKRESSGEDMQQKKYFARSRKRKRMGEPDTTSILRDFIPNYIQTQSAENVEPSQALLVPKQRNANMPSVETTKSRNAVVEDIVSRKRVIDRRSTPETLEIKKRRLLNIQNWAGISEAPLTDAQQRLGESDEENEKHHRRVWKLKKKRLKSNPISAYRHKDLQSATIRIGSQTYQWSPGRNSARTVPRHSGSSQSSITSTRRLFISPKSRPLLNTSPTTASERLRTPGIKRTVRTPSTTPQTGCSGRTQNLYQAEKAFDKPQLIVISSPQLIFHPQPAAKTNGNRSLAREQSFQITAAQSDVEQTHDHVVQSVEQFNIQNMMNMDHLPQAIYDTQITTSEVQEALYDDTHSNEQPENTNNNEASLESSNQDAVSADMLPEQVIKPHIPTVLEAEVDQTISHINGEEDLRWKEFMQGDEDLLQSSDLSHREEQTTSELYTLDECCSVAQSPATSRVPCSTDRSGVEHAEYQEAVPLNHNLSEPMSDELGQVLENNKECLCFDGNTATAAVEEPGSETQNSNTMTATAPPERTMHTRFHRPKLFVGRLAPNNSSLEHGRVGTPSASGSSKGKKARGMKRNRINIRSFPNFNEDPIEEDGY